MAEESRIGVVSDTHDRILPDLREALAGVDEILHCGDLCHTDVLDELEAIAPVLAVHGNMDERELVDRLPAERLVERGEIRIAMIHGHRQGRARVDDFVEKYRVIAPALVLFGHTHETVSRVWDETHYFNPGTAGGVGADPTCGLLEVRGGEFSIEHVDLEG
ncbi:MAG: YfcE family phosphodiesterase [Gemmatimonadota bacterium]|nr:YfcE family phosphodiesterase [Gemmatimonadota bacterium]